MEALTQSHGLLPILHGPMPIKCNHTASETGCGVIPLAGAVIEVFNNGSSSNNYTIRITTSTASVSGALTNAEFIYVFNGTSYSRGHGAGV